MYSSINNVSGAYHLKLVPEQLAKTIFLVGDQNRVGEISKHFDSIEHRISNREFTTHTGFIGKHRISALSTGIGTDNIDITLNELDALINTDLETNQPLEKRTSLDLIRLGTSGTIRKEIEIDSLVVSSHGLGIDNLMHFYANNQFDSDLQTAINQQIKWPDSLSKPYIYSADSQLLSKFSDLVKGITVTAPGFYAPQGRKVRLPVSIEDLHQQLRLFEYKSHKITNFEMETSALYGLGKLMGHRCLTICTILANRATNKKSTNYKKSIDNMIDTTLKRLF